jgi:ribosomal protein S18 acetylase RimI-like enzyme
MPFPYSGVHPMKKEASLLDCGKIREAAGVLGRAFRDDPIVVAILEDVVPEIRVKRLSVMFAADLNTCARRGLPLQVRESDSIACAAIIYPPGAYPLPTSAQLGILLKSIVRNGVYGLGRWLTVLSCFEKRHPKDTHYYLEFIGVDPIQQGKGLGSSLLNDLSSRADQEKVGCYLETSNARNVPLYQRFGYETVAEEEILGVNIWFMWRSPA